MKPLWDEELTKLGVNPPDPKPNAMWQVVSGRLTRPGEVTGATVIKFVVQNVPDDQLSSVICHMDWPQRGNEPLPYKPIQSTGPDKGSCQMPITGELDPGKKNGVHFAYIEREAVSEIVRGMGRIGGKDERSFELTFSFNPGPVGLEAAIKAAAAGSPSLFNTGTEMYKYAQRHNYGYPRMNEFDFKFPKDRGVTYVVQDYKDYVLYIVKADPLNVHEVKK